MQKKNLNFAVYTVYLYLAITFGLVLASMQPTTFTSSLGIDICPMSNGRLSVEGH